MCPDFRLKKLKLKSGDIQVRTRGGLIAVAWKDKREVYMVSNMNHQWRYISILKEKNALKPRIIERHNEHMEYVDQSDVMAKRHSMSRRTVKWTK
jgi:hypothetical protein